MELISDYVVCTSGDTLTSNQAALLRVFDVKMAAFRMSPIGYWLAKGTSLLCIPQCVTVLVPILHIDTVPARALLGKCVHINQ